MVFQSTPPVKAATDFSAGSHHALAFQSTPPVKAATTFLTLLFSHLCISIHAAREGGDVADGVPANFDDISIHAAREGGDNGQSLPTG